MPQCLVISGSGTCDILVVAGGGGGGAGGPFPGMPSAEVQTTYGGNGAPGIVIVAYPT